MQSTFIIRDQEVLNFAWRGLKNFHNIDFCKSKIVKHHSVPEKHHKNAEKQARQIRYCLIQAKEYFDAAQVVGLGTKPLLLYYCCLSLALAQILYRGTGLDSLENARGKNAHHGLALKLDGDIGGATANTFRAIEQLRTAPVIIDGNRIGTFELWEKLSFEFPLVGKDTDKRGGSSVSNLGRILMQSEWQRQWELPVRGVNLLDVFLNSPGMTDWLAQHDIASNIVRGRIERTVADDSILLALVVHPAYKPSLDKVSHAFLFQPSVIPDLVVQAYESGFSMRIDLKKVVGTFSIPQGYMWTVDEIRFPDPDFKLNAFGLYYVGLHILGNLSRYYPEVWMRHIEEHTPLASGSEVFLDLAAVEIALATLTVLSDVFFVPRSR